MYDINTDGSLKPRKRKQQHRPEGFLKRVKEYYYWCKQMKENEQLGVTRKLYAEEIAFMVYMNNYYRYSTKFVWKVDSGKHVFSKDKPRYTTWNKRCDEMLSKIMNHEGPQKESIVNLIEFTASYCSETLQQAWESAMDLFSDPGSLKQWMLALLFIKATNRIADAVIVPYFKKIARQMTNENDPLYYMILKDLTDPEYVAPLIR